MTDYALLIDAETRAFIRYTENWYPPETADASVPQQRRIYNAMCRAFHAGYPKGVTARNDRIMAGKRAIPVRYYNPDAANETAVVIYYHGGGFVVGGLESHDDICAEICSGTGNPVISIDYRLSPEHRHPAAFDDALAAFFWMADHSSLPIVLCGDSAGGNLAAAVTQATRYHPRAATGQLLIYPGLGGAMDSGSYLTHADAPLLSTREVAFYQTVRASSKQDLTDPTFAPLRDDAFDSLPRTFILSAECDPLADDAQCYCKAITAAGGEAHCVVEAGLVHGYLRARHSVSRARDSFRRMLGMLRSLAGDQDLSTIADGEPVPARSD